MLQYYIIDPSFTLGSHIWLVTNAQLLQKEPREGDILEHPGVNGPKTGSQKPSIAGLEFTLEEVISWHPGTVSKAMSADTIAMDPRDLMVILHNPIYEGKSNWVINTLPFNKYLVGCLGCSVRHLTLDFSTDHGLRVVGLSSALGCALSMGPAQVSLSLPLPLFTFLSLSLSSKTNKKKQISLSNFVCIFIQKP